MKLNSLLNKLSRGVVGISLAMAVQLLTGMTLSAANLVQEFYLPMPEADIYTANKAIVPSAGATNFSTFSIVVTGDGTVIHYDQWEDGYEVNLGSPSQSSTLIWGDGNNANGIPQGMTNDPQGLVSGTVITLTNNVPLPRNPLVPLWDARDRLGATKALVISRAAWPSTTGPVFAGAAGVLSTMDYGTNYISPVGQDMTNGLFRYVGMFVMAAQNNTAVTIDTNGTGVGTSSLVLNQGESYLINGGLKKGGRITATKPVQADLLVGHVGVSYASDWFTLYPVGAWDNSYYTPVATAANGNPAYVYLFNPATNAIVINYNTRVGSGNFSIPGSNGVFQFVMPVGSGASFISAGGQNFFPICTVAANPASDTSFNWGFTLVPKGALTTEATVGWGPGSADGTVNGSPVWVTALAATTIYVDYRGDRLGAVIDPNGNHCDTNFTLVALQSQKIFDPSKNQTGMRVYTTDGTLLAAAWGEDPDVASPGNPYIDAGTTVLPFPVPVLIKSALIVTDAPPTGLSLNDSIEYSVQLDNRGLLPLGNTVVIDAPSTNLAYIANSTSLDGVAIADSGSGTLFPLDTPGYTIPVILSQGSSTFRYRVRVIGSGTVSNSVNIGGTTIFSQTYLAPASTNGTTCGIFFSDTNGVAQGLYAAGTRVYLTLTNFPANTSASTLQTLAATVRNTTHGDLENITLTETSANSGVFRNLGGLATSLTAGLGAQDSTLNVTAGDFLSTSYTDANLTNTCTAIAAIQIPSQTKQLYFSVNNSSNGVQALNRIDPVAYAHSPLRPSVDLTGASSGTVLLDYVSTVSNLTFNATVGHITSAAANRLMLVGISMNRTDATTFETPTNVAYAGQPLTVIGARTNGDCVVWLYYLINPTTGSNNVVVNFDKSNVDGEVIGCATFTGVNQATPLGSFFSNTGTSTAPSLVLTSAPGELVFDTVGIRSGNFGAAGSPGTNQTSLWKTFFNSKIAAGASTRAGAATVTNTWSAAGSSDWTLAAVSIKPASVVSGGTNVTAFTQTPAFAAAFTMPSNSFITITNFITVTNGSMPANPAITATLRYGTTNLITLSAPTYSAVNSNLIWSGSLSSNVTIPANQFITCTLSNGETGVAFHVDYDVTNKPSKISLPATTIIAINTFGIYDAPYPGGSLVTTPVAGTTIYARAQVTDPFGSYDITSLGLAITAPNTNENVAATLNDTFVVATNASSKTYEYAYSTTANYGSYTIAVTANEGTEGVTAVASTGLYTIFLDLGTPSITAFINGTNGAVTNSYSANSLVCVRVNDLNRNTNATTPQIILATVSSSAGDSEILSFTETGTNTGIFTACLNTTTNPAVTVGNGTLTAPVGSILTANYSDPTDPSDNTSATATIQPAPGVPGIYLNKTILAPTSSQALIGDAITYNLQIVNVGSTTLTNVALTDTFPATRLTNAVASVTPNVIAAGSLSWTNLGTFAPGRSTNITVTFTAAQIGTATNSATANGGTATNSSSVTLTINSAGLVVSKTLTGSTNQPVAVGSNVVFRITVQNVGSAAIVSLPFQDTFSGVLYQYVSATLPPDSSGYGTLLWTNLASVPLATNAILTNTITMRVIGQGSPANNTATADFAVDILGNVIPTASSTIGVTTAAGSISGKVYNDKDQSGTVTTNDTTLNGVTMNLYSDPNGDGNPADGALLQVTTTDSNGYYEFLNLTLGNYVVVANHLPGFDSVGASSNRKALALATLTSTNNNNFFEYQPAATLSSTITGKVWNDVNGNGTNDLIETGLGNVTVEIFDDANTNGLVDLGESLLSSTSTDTNGNYSFANITPGYYVIRETDLYGYYSSGDTASPNDNQIPFSSTNGIVSTNNSFYDRLAPTAVNDTNTALYFVPTILSPLTNDISPNGDVLVLTNVFSTNGIVVINPGSTNLTFTPTNFGVTTIAYTLSDGHGGTSNAVITVTVSELANLAVGKTGFASVFAASNLAYTISVTNLGPTPASSVIVTDSLPASVTFVSASSGGVNNSGVVTWSLGTLTNNQISSLTVTVTAPASGSLTNVASVGSPTPDPTPTNNVTPPVITSVTPVANLGIGKTASATVVATNNLTYTISVTNFGPSSASSVVVTDTLPASVTFVSATGSGSNNSGLVTWNLGTLSSNQVTNLTLIVTAPASGTLTNVASVGSPTGDPTPTNNVTPPVITTVTPVANVALGKSGPAGVTFGTSFNYTISVTNFGPSTAASLSVTDSLPAGLVFVSSVPSTTTNASNQVIWPNLGNLAASATTNLTLTVTSVARGSVTNFASGGSPTLDPNPTNNLTPPVVTAITNIPPIANPDSSLMTENTTNTLSPLVNDVVQTPGGSLSLISISPTNGTANISGTNIVFTPNNNFLGTATIGYVITDNVGGTNSAVITITVTNIPPLANPDAATIGANSGTNTFSPLVNDAVQTPGGNLSLVSVTTTNGSVGISGTNVWFAPTTNFVGVTTIVYTITDNIGGTNTGLITVTVTNRLPVLVADTASTPKNIAVTIPVLANDSDPDGNALTLASVTQTNGTASISGTNIVFTPSTNFLGNAIFTYTATDGFGGSNTALITVTVTNRLPVAVDDSASTPKNVLVSIPALFNDSDPDGDVLTLVSVSPTNGTAVISGTNVNFTPTTNFLGTATIGYVITDGFGGTNSAVISVNITNRPPSAVDDTASTPRNVAVTIPVLLNDSDLDGDALTIISVSPTNGTANISGTNIVFLGTTNFQGTATIGYGITDNFGGTNFAVVTVTITNRLPVALPDSISTARNTQVFIPVLDNDSDPDNDVLAIYTVASTNGHSFWSSTNLLFRPANNFQGVTIVGYTVSDGFGGFTSALITVTVTNHPPVTLNDTSATPKNISVTVPVLVNDFDADGDVLSLVSVSPTNGTANISGTSIVFLPTTNFLGTATVGYVITDGFGGTNFGLLTIAVTNHPPVAMDDTAATPMNLLVTLSPLGNDSDLDGDELSLVSVSPTNGTAVISGTNVDFTPATNFLGTATIGYVITDSFGGTNSAVITVSVTNRPPVALDDTGSTPKNVAVTIPVLVNDTDPDNNPLTIVSVSPTNGTALINGTNVNFTPDTNFLGTATIGYGVTDNFGATNFALITITVTNRLPVAVNDARSTPENVAITIPVLSNDTDADGDGLSLVSVSPTNGVANISGTNVIFTPATNFLGTATIGYVITDGFGGTNSALITVTVTNIPPVANPDAYSVAENSTNTFSPLVNDVVLTPGGTLSIVSVSPTNGTANISGTNVSFVPTTNFLGTATIGYVITDGIGGTNSSVITVTVTNIPPLANPDGYTILENSTNTFSVLTNDVVRTPGGTLAIVSVSTTNGTANILGTNAVFAPGSNFIGTLTINYVITDSIGGTNSSVVTVTVLPVADIAVTKTGPATILAATNFDYTITVTNFGPGAAATLSVTDSLPASVSFVTASSGGALNGGQVIWANLGSLAAGTATNLTVTVTAPADSASLTNVASGGSPTSDPKPTNNISPPVITTVTPSANLAIGKVAPANVTAVSNLTYTISVTNFGPSSASSVVVTDTLPASVTFVSATGSGSNNSGLVTWNLGTLSSNQVTNLTLIVTAPASGTLTNIASVGSPTGDPTPTNNVTPPVITVVSPLADLQIGKVGPATVLATSNLTYTISITNVGPSSASSVVVTDTLPASVTFVVASDNGVNNSGVVTWSLGTLSSGQVSNVTVTVTAPAAGSLTNVANVNSPTTDPTPTNNVTPPVTTSVIPQADLGIGKIAPATVFAASNLSYTISVTNFGPSSASSVVVTDTLPTTVTFVSASDGGSNDNGVVTWNCGTLISGQISNVTVTVTAPASGSLTNTATVNSPTGDPTPTNNLTPPVITTVTPLADVRISKSGPAGIIFGTNYNYTISVTNFGPSTAASLSVTDSLPAGLVFVSSIPSATTNVSNQVIWPDLGNLISGGSTNLTLTVISTVRGSLTNTATVGSPTGDPVPTNNLTPPVVTLVTNFPPLANPDNYSMTENTTNTLIPLVNDVVQTPGGSLTLLSVSSTNGVASISGTNVSFTPDANFIGTAFVGYLISDNVGGTNSSVITILVTNIPPLANTDNYSAAQNTTNTFSPLLNDSVQTLGGNLSLVSLTPTNGTASISGTNVSFVPTLNFLGTTTIGYVITDGIGGTNSSVITITFTNVPPLANPDNYSVAENTTNNLLSPLVNDTLLTPGGNLSLISVSPTNGTAVISGTNVWFTPTTNFLGTATIGYVITDNIGGTNSSVITISVTNRPPLAVNDAVFTGINLPVTVPVLVNDSDPDGNPLSLVSVSPTNGTANILGTNVVFTPATNFIGTGYVHYVITDGNGGSNSALVTITVTNIVVIPTADPQSVTTTENTAKAITLTGSDVRSQPLTFILVSSPTNGALSLFNTNTGAITYTPATNYFGADTFTFRVNNGQTNSAIAAVNITVLPVADLAVMKFGATNGLAGSNLVYTITVTNRGPAAATNIVVTDQLPTGFTFVSATSGGASSNNFVNWNLATLAVGKGTNFTLTAYSLEGGTFTNLAFATSPTTDLNPTNNNGSQTNAQRVTVVSARADLAVFKEGGTNVFAGATIVYTITATNLGPSTASNVVVSDILPGGATFTSATSGYTMVSNVVSWSLLSLPRGVATNFTVTLTATALSNAFVNVALGTSTTPDPVLTNNNGTALKARVSTKVTPQADVRVLMFGPTNVVVGDSFSYTIIVSNAGPSSASNVVLVDSLPLALTFNSASSGGIFSNAFYNITWPKVLKLAVGATTNYTLTVTAPAAGLFTNLSYATATTPDIDLTNNNGTLPDSQVQTRALAGQFNWLQGVPIFNPQTGLYEETVVVTNIGSGTVAAIRLNVNILTPGISLNNAAGTNNGVPFVRYDLPLDPSNTVTFLLEFYDPLRVAFTNTLSVTALSQPVVSVAGTNGFIAVSSLFTDLRIPGDTRYVLEFTTTPGKVYTIIYSDDLVTWRVATPSVHANANVTQWYDDGPPKTESKSPARFYRVFQN